MTLRTRFVIVLFMFWVAVCLNIYAAIYYSNFLLARAENLFATSFPAEVTLEAARQAVAEQHALLLATLERRSIDDQARDDIRNLAIVIDSTSKRAGQLSPEGPSASFVFSLQQELAAYQNGIAQYLDAGEGEDVARRQANFATHHPARYLALTHNFQAVLDILNRAQRLGVRETQASADKVNRVLFGMACAELLILIVTLSIFGHWILKPIAAIRVATEQIAAGNLDYRLEHGKRDELGALAGEVNHMAASLAVAQRQLKQKERMAAMGEMVSVVAHNIRNPLAGIRATAQTCLHESPPGSAVNDHQQRIINAVDSLEQWLKELLHLNRPIALNIEAVGIDGLVTELEQIFQPTTQRKNVDIDYTPLRPGQTVGVDRQHFVQAFASILDNAIEASPAGSTVRIRTGIDEQDSRAFVIEIADAGSGVPDQLRKQVFEPYFSTKPGGTGIGLSMAKKIIEAHSGRLSLRNGQPDDAATAGAVFRIEIPHHGDSSSE